MLGQRRAISLAGLERRSDPPWGTTPRAMVDWALALGARGIQIDAAMDGTRARDLDQSARRDLAAVIRRAGATCSGLDLWIPPSHFAEPARQSRAADAVREACGFAADLRRLGAIEGQPVVSIATHADSPAGVLDRLVLDAEHVGARVADHRWPMAPTPRMGIGIDAAAVLLSGDDPARAVTAMVEPPAAARLSDMTSVGRCVAGQGRLKIDEYVVALSVARYAGWLVVDLRGLPDQENAARALIG